MPSNTVVDLEIDRDGYLWMATHDGLARYDGVEFRVWRHLPDDQTSLPNNTVQAVHIDAQNRVWVGISGETFHMLDTKRKKFKHYTRADYPEIGAQDIYAITSTPDDTVWFATYGDGLLQLDSAGKMRRFTAANSALPSDKLYTVKTDITGRLWIGTHAGVAWWDGRTFHTVDTPGLNNAWITAISPQIDGSVLIATEAEIFRINISKDSARSTILLDAGHARRTQAIIQYGDALWIASQPGLSRYSTQEITQPLSWAKSYFFFDAIQDREGGAWFASESQGLIYLLPQSKKFSVFSPRQGDSTSPSLASYRDFSFENSNTLWMAGGAGIVDAIDLSTGHTQHYSHYIPDRANSTYCVLKTKDGALWMCSSNGLYRRAPDGTTENVWLNKEEKIGGYEYAESLIDDRAGNVWLAIRPSTLHRYDSKGRLLWSYNTQKLSRDNVKDIEQIFVGPDQAIWIAGLGGMARWNEAQKRFDDAMPDRHDWITSFAFASDNTVWLHSQEGLEHRRWDGRYLRLLQRVSVADGIPATESGGIAVYDNNVWLATRRGLVHWDTARQRARIYGVGDGLPSNEFTERPIVVSPEGIAVAGTTEGVVAFDVRNAPETTRTPTLAIDQVTLLRGKNEIEFVPGAHIKVLPEDRDLRISARLLSFADPKTHLYRYQMHGYDPDWVMTPGSTDRVFSQLDPGHYRLDVQASNVNRVWSATRTLDIDVVPPWWRTWWATTLFVLIALAMTAWMMLAYRRRIRRRHNWQLSLRMRELAEQASEAKTKFLATLGHEVRTPMTGVLGMSELLLNTTLDQKQLGYAQSIRRAGEHLMRLVNDTLDLARIEAGKLELDVQTFDVHVLIEDVATFMSPLAQQRGLEFEIEITDSLPRRFEGDAMRIRQILMNLIGNAIKFTEQGRVLLRTEPLAPQGIRLTVSDTGPGLNEEQQQRLFKRFEQADGARTATRYGGSGLGLAICQELAGAMDGRITVETRLGEGAHFTVELPLPIAEVTTVRFIQDVKDSGSRLNLLLVEDDPIVAEVIVGLLQAQGHRVTHSAHGLAALADYGSSTDPIDMGLLDLDLPGIDGFALAQQLRAQGFTQPLLAVTARADLDSEAQALAAGFDGFLRKPLTGEMLATAMQSLLEQHFAKNKN